MSNCAPDIEEKNDLAQKCVERQTLYPLQITSTDTLFFFNYNDSSLASFGTAVFFIQILENNYTFKYYPDFDSSDQFNTCLINDRKKPAQFDSFHLVENALSPNFNILNEIKHIRHSRDGITIDNLDTITFRVTYRYLLLDAEVT